MIGHAKKLRRAPSRAARHDVEDLLLELRDALGRADAAEREVEALRLQLEFASRDRDFYRRMADTAVRGVRP